jgi:hypothetical protein
MAPYRPVKGHRRFGGMNCLQSRRVSEKKQPARLRQQADLGLFFDMWTVLSSETSEIFRQATRCHVPDDSIRHSHYLSIYI